MADPCEWLLRTWLPAMPDVVARLHAGARIAAVACGSGEELLCLAAVAPHATFVGFDAAAPLVERARAAAEDAGFAGRVSFEQRDCSTGLPGRFDVIVALNVDHAVVCTVRLLCEIRRALRPDGRFVCLTAGTLDEDQCGATSVWSEAGFSCVRTVTVLGCPNRLYEAIP